MSELIINDGSGNRLEKHSYVYDENGDFVEDTDRNYWENQQDWQDLFDESQSKIERLYEKYGADVHEIAQEIMSYTDIRFLPFDTIQALAENFTE